MATSLNDVDFGLLKKIGIKYIAFDADSTLVPARGTVLNKDTQKFLAAQRKGFKAWCIASNRPFHDLDGLAGSIDAGIVYAHWFVRKPRKVFFDEVLELFKDSPDKIAMVGDKLIADMFGAKKAGMTTVWVDKIGNDNPWDQLLFVRRWENRLMKAYLKEA
jgi:HAD superfamily phosphatase (TIGR01668 family)